MARPIKFILTNNTLTLSQSSEEENKDQEEQNKE